MTDIRQMLLNLSNTLKNIDENPNVANDAEFTERLQRLSDDIDELLRRAQELKRMSLFVFIFCSLSALNCML